MPDFLRDTKLGGSIDQYSFFSYELSEALHLSLRERQIVLDCFGKIQRKLSSNLDKHSKQIIHSSIELFLSHCTRFYDRPFITRDTVNLGIIANFQSTLLQYFKSGKARELGFTYPQHFTRFFKNKIGYSPNEYRNLS